MLQGKRDVDTVLTMGIMEDVSIIPQPAGGKIVREVIEKNYVNLLYPFSSVTFLLVFVFSKYS